MIRVFYYTGQLKNVKTFLKFSIISLRCSERCVVVVHRPSVELKYFFQIFAYYKVSHVKIGFVRNI